VSIILWSPNPEIEKTDITNHGGLREVFLKLEFLILQIISLSHIIKERPKLALPFLSF
jgi:hypothetical protein